VGTGVRKAEKAKTIDAGSSPGTKLRVVAKNEKKGGGGREVARRKETVEVEGFD